MSASSSGATRPSAATHTHMQYMQAMQRPTHARDNGQHGVRCLICVHLEVHYFLLPTLLDRSIMPYIPQLPLLLPATHVSPVASSRRMVACSIPLVGKLAYPSILLSYSFEKSLLGLV